VYAAGGKRGLLDALVHAWVTDPIVQRDAGRIAGSDDPVEIMRFVANGVRTMREGWSDVIHMVLTTAPHDGDVAEQLKIATDAYRAAFVPIAEKLAKLGALASDIDVPTDGRLPVVLLRLLVVLTLHDDNHWSYERAEQWLADQASHTLLAPQ
jgi:hypothetical protein